MKIKYEFATETVEIEVTDEWATVIADLDRQDYNVEHRETRRHCSLEAYDADGNLLASDENLEREMILSEENEHLNEILNHLKPRQRFCVEEYVIHGRSFSDIGRQIGMQRSSVEKSVKHSLEKLKKYF